MATRGRKPTPAHLKLIMGNPGKRPIREDGVQEGQAPYDNGLEPPVKLAKRQKQLWSTACWLTQFDVPRAFMWVELHAEFERGPTLMIAAKVAQLRALGSELGLDPASRTRIGAIGAASGEDARTKDKSEQYFTA
jgi:hypothetical protein